VQQYLLEQGLATHIVIPPNLEHLECYAATEKNARKTGAGMWQRPEYAYRETTTLGSTDTGFHFIQGKVTHTAESKTAIWINLEGKTALRIGKQNLGYFEPDMRKNIVGKRVQAKGWLHYNKKRKELFMQVHHPASLKVVDK